MTDKEYKLYHQYCKALGARREIALTLLRDALKWYDLPNTPCISKYIDDIWQYRPATECEDLAELICYCEDLERYINDCTMQKLSENLEVTED